VEPILEQVRKHLSQIAQQHALLQDHIRVATGPISPRQAIGTPIRQDFPLLTGKEVIVEAEFRGSYGQAFTSQPKLYEGSLKNVLELPLSEAGNRAILLSTLNAVTSYLGMAERVRHCRDNEPEQCASEIASDLFKRFGELNIGMIGYQPAILENLSKTFGAQHIKGTDLSPTNIGKNKFGVEIWDGATGTSRLIDWGDLLLVTSSTLSNGTFDNIYEEIIRKEKKMIIFGITGAGVSALLNIERICFYGH
jgi:uncharacterized protein (DUF4213/DUF364 family)